MTFDDFVVSSETRFAHAAATAVADAPGAAYNPVVLYGPSRAGKTHLLRAIAAALPGHRALLVSADELATTLRDHPGSVAEADVLLVDDLGSAEQLDPIAGTLSRFVADRRQVVVVTRHGSDAIAALRVWGSDYDWGLIVDCWPRQSATPVG